MLVAHCDVFYHVNKCKFVPLLHDRERVHMICVAWIGFGAAMENLKYFKKSMYNR